jgi:hypothetical protein
MGYKIIAIAYTIYRASSYSTYLKLGGGDVVLLKIFGKKSVL